MKTFLLTTPQKKMDKNLFVALKSLYEDLNIRTARSNAEMEFLLKSDTYDLAIIYSGSDALALSAEVITKTSSIPVLVYTDTNYIPYIKKLYGLGVSGVLNVSSSEQELSKAVTDVLAKRIYMSESLKELLLLNTVINDNSNDRVSELPKPQNSSNRIKYEMPLTFINGRMMVFTECLN